LSVVAGNRKNSKSSILSKLPRLSNFVWLLIVCAVVLIVALPMFLSTMFEFSSQELLRNQLVQLQNRYNDLQRQKISTAELSSEVDRLKVEIEKTAGTYPEISTGPEIMQILIDMAWKYDITITGMEVSQGTKKYGDIEYPLLIYTIKMSGQVPAFQNYLLDSGLRLPTAEVTSVVFEPAQSQGKLDKATITISVVCKRQ